MVLPFCFKIQWEKDRSFFILYIDFPSNSTGKKLKNKKKGNNQNEFWNSKVSVKSTKRKKEFLF